MVYGLLSIIYFRFASGLGWGGVGRTSVLPALELLDARQEANQIMMPN